MKYFYKFKNRYSEELAVFDLVNRHFFKSKVGIIMSATLPLIFMLIYLIFSISKNDYSMLGNSLPVYISLTILPITLIALPLVIVEFKQSIILRKIAISKITALKLSLLLLLYYFIVLLCSTLLTITIYAIFLNKHASYYFSLYNWAEFLYAIINVYLLSLTIGLFLGVICKKTSIVQTIGIGLMFLTLALSGQLIPMSVVASTNAIKYISLFSPLSYPLALLNNIFIVVDIDSYKLPEEILNQIEPLLKGSSIFNIDNFYIIDFDKDKMKINPIVVYYGWQKVLNLIFPFIISFLIMIFNIKKFNWTSR